MILGFARPWRRARLGMLAAVIGLACGRGVAAQAPATPRTDLDVVMEQVLANRDDTWKHLRDYVLDERERFALVGPDGRRLFGQDRTYTWYARDGIGVRSPVSANGVTVSEAERRQYEDDWLRDERNREARQIARKVQTRPGDAGTTSAAVTPDGTQASLTNALEPRFVSEAFFLRFRFEPGNYFFAGRETLDGRDVLKIEYLPTRLYDDEKDRTEVTSASDRKDHDGDIEDDIDRKMNKVALVTLWVDQQAKQIVRYTFDNVEFGFLPGRAIVRLDTVRASMTMAQVLDGVWLPRTIDMDGAVTLATGAYRVDYLREFSGYRRGETSVTIRVPERH